MPATPESRRFKIIAQDLDKSVRELAVIFGISPISISRMLRGEQELNFTVIKVICITLGYSPIWLLMGTGNKKLKSSEAKPVTEIQLLRSELTITSTLNMKLQARLTGVETEYEALKKEVEQLNNWIKR